jgi:ribosomal-protein-alanine N-acetyltransferase
METSRIEPLCIRIAVKEDLAAIYSIESNAVSAPWSRNAIAGALEQERALNLVAATSSGKVLGYFFGTIVADELSIHSIVTHPQFRRQGIGLKLMEIALVKARNLGVCNGYLEVRSKNLAAQALYASLGFVKQSERKKYYADDGDSALLMALQL